MASLLQVGLALILVVSATTGDDKCRTGCGGVTPNTFKYAEGNTYKYEYEGSIDLSLSSAEGQKSSTKVKATVLLTQQAQCNQILRVQNLQIISGDSKRYTNIADIEKPIKLNFHDGHLEDVICTEPSDTQNSLNIKRAVASMFQAATKHHGKEIDVFGSCPTEFTTRKEGGLQVIKKTRNLNECSLRESLRQDFMTTAFDQRSEIKTSPFLQGSYEAELKLKGGIPQLITVTEGYLYVPFSNGDEGAKADVVSQLKYVGTSKDNPRVSCNIPRTLLFDDPHPITSDKSTVGTILNAVKNAANAIDLNVKETSASKFSSIIKLMRGAAKKDLAAVYSQVRSGAGFSNKETAKRVFLDALFRASTGEAVEVGIEIYKSHGLSEIESKVFFVGLNFVKHVTEDALSAAANLLSTSENLSREAYLGIGVLAGRYCRQHSCENVKGLSALLKTLQSKLVSRPADRITENLVVTVLKAISNAGHVTNVLAGKIVELAQDKQAPSRIRVAALEAYLSDSCNDRFRDSGVNILKDIQQDSEIRIKAYLAITECPNGKVAGAIKKLLQDEPSIQVGGFIVSHLATIRSSANPDKALAKAQLGEIRTVKRFPVDFRQYSFNGEYSYDFDSLGVAESLESNIIYSQKSFLPRSTSLNLTTEVFGHRYNFLEIDTRQENLDMVLHAFVGPYGLLRQQSPQSLFQNGAQRLKELIEKASQRIVSRPKRDVNKNQIETFAKQLTDKQNSLNKDLDLDLSIKLFGSELLFLSLSESPEKYTPENILDSILDAVDNIKSNARDFDKTLTSNLIFLDAVVSYPTSTGFPLRLSVEGASSSQLKTSGKIDINSFLERNGNFKLSVVPSINIEVTARFVVDAALVESGLSVVGNLYSSVGGAFELSLSSHEIDYKFTLPNDKQELISFTHNIVFETRELCGPEVQTPLKFIQSKDFSVCLDQLNPFIGLTFCAKLNQPNIAEASSNILPYPLNGDSKVSVTIDKTDFGYFHYQVKELKGGFEGIYEVVDTSRQPKASIKYEFNIINPAIVIDLTSPVKSAKFEARLVDTRNEYYGILRLSSDELEYYAKLGAQYAQSGTRTVYKPIMEYKAGQGSPEQLPYHLEGQIIVEETGGPASRKLIFDNLKLVSPDRKPISVSGNVNFVKFYDDVSADLTLDDTVHKGSIKGRFLMEKHGLSTSLQLVNNFNPIINFDLKYKLQVLDRYNIDSDFQIIHGPDISNKNALFKLSNNIKRKGEGENSIFSTEHELSYPGLNLDDKFKLELSKKSIDLEVLFAYKNIKLGTELDAEIDKRNKGDFKVDFELYGFENKLEVELSRNVNGYKSSVHHKITLNGNCLEVIGEVKHLIEQHRGDIGHDLVIKITSLPDIKWKSELKYTQNDIDTFIKVISGHDVWIDAFLKANKVGDANGNLKVSIPGRLTANGQVKSNKGSGNVNLLLNLLEIQRKLKSEIAFTVKEPTYNFDVIFYSDFEKDNSRKYHLSTENTFEPGKSLNTRNTLDILGQKSVLNLKLSNTGDINGFDQQAAYEVILPDQQYFAGKLTRNFKNDKGLWNGQAVLNLEQRPNKNAAGRTLSLKALAKNVNTNEGILDIAYNLAVDNGAGKTLNGELHIQQSKAGEERHIDYNGKLYGSIMPHSWESTVSAKYGETRADYKLSSNYGKIATLNVKGKYDLQDPESKRPCTGELAVDVLAPNSRIKIVKLAVQGSVLSPNTEADSLEIKSSGSLFVDDDGTEQGATLDIKSESDWKLGIKEGHIKETIRAQKLDPISINLGYQYEPDKKYEGDVTVQYAKNKVVKGSLEIDTPNNETATIDLHLETPDDRAKSVRLQSHITDTDDTFKAESTFTVNDLKYSSQVEIVLDEKHPWYNIELKYPSGKIDKLYSKLIRMDDNSVAGESKIVLHVYDFSLEDSFDVTIRDIEDFQIKIAIDCPKLNLNKIAFTANTKDVHGSKKLLLNAKQNDKNVLNGALTYKIRKEEGKLIVDGSGTLTVNNEKRSGNFKVLYRELDEKRDKEDGVELTINSVIGSKAFDIEYILTTDHFKYLTSYCVEKKECAHVEVEAKSPNDVSILQINIDLRPLGVSHEFGLKSETQWKQVKHTLDVHLVSNQFKYQYSILILPTESHFTLTTPKRIVSLEAQANSPRPNEPFKGSVVLYLNKKQKPNEKTVLDFEVLTKPELEGSFNLKLTTPGLGKPLAIKYKQVNQVGKEEGFELILDILPTGNKKFITSTFVNIDKQGDIVTIKNTDLLDLQPLNYVLREEILSVTDTKKNIATFDYTLTSSYLNRPAVFSYNWKISTEAAYVKLILNNHVIFDISSTARLGKEYSVVNTEYKFIGIDSASSRLEVKDGNRLTFVFYKTTNPSNKLQVNSGLIPGSIADFRVSLQSTNKKVDLVHGSVKLDEADFGKSDYGIDSNNIKKYLISPAKILSQEVAKASMNAVSETVEATNTNLKHATEAAKASKPDYSPVFQYYQKEVNVLREELITDQSLKQLGESVSNVVTAAITVSLELINTVTEIVEQVFTAVQTQSFKLWETLQKDIWPKFQELVNNLAERFVAFIESTSNLVSGVLDQISAFLDAHQKELKEIATAVSQISKEIIRFIQKASEQLSDVVTSEVSKLTEELKALPITEDLQNYVKMVSTRKDLPEASIQEFKQHVEELKSRTQYDKVARFITLTGAYLEKKMRNQACNDVAEITEIVSAAIDAIDQVIDDLLDEKGDGPDLFDLPIPSKILETLPDLVIAQDSLLRRLINGDIPNLSQLSTFATLNPRQWFVPFRKHAIIVQGQHIFTFDGKHLTFPGKCSYLLARDTLKDRFSIVGTYANGALQELTFSDVSDIITLKKSGAVSLNGAASELPARGKHTHAYRTYEDVQINSDFGVRIYCAPDLSLCLFSLSGFYHGYIRGILGNANSEPYDDYTLPKGQIVTSESDFGNAYKLQANCPAVQTVDHHTHHHAESCTKLFTEINELSICFPFVNPGNFRQACDHGVAANIPNTESAIATAYAVACSTRYIPTFVPKEYVKCENSDKPYDVYDTFSVKLPQKAADIVFAIDANKENADVYKELVTALGNSLIKELADRGIKDVEYHVLTYGGEYPDWPAHITTNGGKMTFKGKMPNVKFGEPPVDDDIDVGHETANFFISLIKNYIEEFNLAIGNEPQSRAYIEAVQYPFRANALKTVIAVSSSPCVKGEFQWLQKLRALLLRQPLVHLNLITPLTKEYCNFKVKDEKTTKTVIGFNSEAVFTTTDAKKKPTGNTDLLKDLEYNDFCSEEVALGGGNVFVLDNFNKNNKKIYTSVASYNIAESLTSSEQGLDCICLRNGLFKAENRCRVVHSKKVPSSKKLLKG